MHQMSFIFDMKRPYATVSSVEIVGDCSVKDIRYSDSYKINFHFAANNFHNCIKSGSFTLYVTHLGSLYKNALRRHQECFAVLSGLIANDIEAVVKFILSWKF